MAKARESDPLMDLLFERPYDGPKKKGSKVKEPEDAEDGNDGDDSEDDEDEDSEDEEDANARGDDAPKPDDKPDDGDGKAVNTPAGPIRIEHIFRPAGSSRRRRSPAAPASKKQGR